MKEKLLQIKDGFKNMPKKTKLIVVLGLIGILLILCSELFLSGRASSKVLPSEPSQADYVAALEKGLETMLSKVKGVGRTEVLISLEMGSERVYAKEEKTISDQAEEVLQSGLSKSEAKQQSEVKYIYVDDSSGKRQALLLTELEPKIKGVIVACEGGDNQLVQLTVTEAVKTYLGISSSRVYVMTLNR